MIKHNLAEKAFLIIACLLCLLFTFMAGGCTSHNNDIESEQTGGIMNNVFALTPFAMVTNPSPETGYGFWTLVCTDGLEWGGTTKADSIWGNEPKSDSNWDNIPINKLTNKRCT